MMLSYALLAALLLGFILTFAATPLVIRYNTKKKKTGSDVHKLDKREIPEMGGAAIMLGFTLAVVATATLYGTSHLTLNPKPVYAGLAVFLIAGLVGLIDDLFKLHHHVKPLLLLCAAIPLILLRTGTPAITLPYLTVDFTSLLGLNLAIIYWLVVVPLGITGAANVVNMLAGFNGLMSGQGLVYCSALAVIALLAGSPEAALLFAAMAGAQAAFLYFNRAPARVFPGDVGTLSLGALVAAGIIIGNIEFVGVLVLLPHLVNASMSLLSVGSFFEERQFMREKLSALDISPQGLISFTRLEKPVTLCKLLLYKRPQREGLLVFKLNMLTLFSSIIALAWFLRLK